MRQTADQVCYLTHWQYTDTVQPCLNTDFVTLGVRQDSHWNAEFESECCDLFGSEVWASHTRGGRLDHPTLEVAHGTSSGPAPAQWAPSRPTAPYYRRW